MKPAILLAIANDHRDPSRFLRELESEAREIARAFSAAGVLCDFLPPLVDASFAEIRSVFQKNRDRIAVFHFAGHANGLSLFMESARGSEQGVRGANLAEFLSAQNNLQLVFLNGCSTGPQCDHFTRAGVASVISTSQQINDTVARSFATEFYRSLARGASIQVAYREAVAAGKPNNSDSPRGLYFGDENTKAEVGEWPWSLRFAQGAEHAGDWNLPDASGNPLFGTPEIPSAIQMPDSPFKSLKRFDREDARIFFGRGFEVRDLYNKVVDPEGPAVILYYGQSGVGKSSLLDAGLLPRLADNFRVRYRRRDECGLTEGLRLAISSSLESSAISQGWSLAENQLLKKHGRPHPLVVILDQVEELYTHPDPKNPDELEQFAGLLKDIFVRANGKPAGKLILGFRKEWLAEISKVLTRFRVPFCSVFLDRLGHRGVVEAISLSRPVREHFGLTVDSKLADSIATDLLGDPASPVAPTLQILLAGMWKSALNSGKSFTHDLYQQTIRDGLSLDDFVSGELKRLSPVHPELMQTGLALDLLNRHTTELGTAAVRTETELKSAYVHHWRAVSRFIEHCKDSYLLIDATSEEMGKEPVKSSRLAHDTLAPLIRRRFDESDFPGQRARRIMDSRIQEWEDGKSGDPLDEFDLKTVQDGINGMSAMNEDELRLVRASEDERIRRQSARRRTRIAGFAALVTIAAIGLLAWVFWQNSQKNNLLRIAESQQKLSTQIQTEMQNGVTERDQYQNWFKAFHHFAKAGQLAAGKHADSSLSETADLHSIENARFAALLALKETGLVQAFDLDLNLDPLQQGEGSSLTGAELPRTFAQLDDSASLLLAWSSSSRLTGKPDFLQVWEVESGETRIPMMRYPEQLLSAGINDAGTRFFWLSQRGKLNIFAIPDKPGAAVQLDEFTDVQKALFRPGSDDLVLWTQDRIEMVLEGKRVPVLEIEPGVTINDVAFSPNKTLVATGRRGEVTSGLALVYRDLLSQEKSPTTFDRAFERSTISEDGRFARFWSYGDGDMIIDLIDGRETDFHGSTDGETLIAIDAGRRVSWSTLIEEVILDSLPGHTGTNIYRKLPLSSLTQARVSDDGKLLATVSKEGGLIWDLLHGDLVTPPLLHSSAISDIRFHTGKNLLVTCGLGGTIRIWNYPTKLMLREGNATASKDLADGKPGGQTVLTREEVCGLLPSLSDSKVVIGGRRSVSGQKLVTWDMEGIARVWDLESGESVSQAMVHPSTDTGADSRPRQIHGAKFVLADRVIVSWTGLPILRLGDPTYMVNGFVRFWDASTGSPLSELFWCPAPVHDLEFDEAGMKFITHQQYSPQTAVRSLPKFEALPADIVEYGKHATGTQINSLGEFQFLTADEWRNLKKDSAIQQ